MADKMNIYTKTLIPTLLIFLIGVMAGIWIDNFRLTSARNSISESEISWNDAQLFNAYFRSLGTDSCDTALDINLEYNENIYNKGTEIEKTIKNNVFTPEIEQEWKRYNLLQLQFWLNSIELKERCNFDYHTIVHLDELRPKISSQVDSKIQSQILVEFKEKCGNKIMLIPLDIDLDLISIDSIVNQFSIQELPAVIIDENIVLQGITSTEELQEIVKC